MIFFVFKPVSAKNARNKRRGVRHNHKNKTIMSKNSIKILEQQILISNMLERIKENNAVKTNIFLLQCIKRREYFFFSNPLFRNALRKRRNLNTIRIVTKRILLKKCK